MKEPKRYYCGSLEGMFEDDTNGHWIEYSEHKAIVEELNQALRIPDVDGSLPISWEQRMKEIRELQNSIDKKIEALKGNNRQRCAGCFSGDLNR
jgi:hypothetical protein